MNCSGETATGQQLWPRFPSHSRNKPDHHRKQLSMREAADLRAGPGVVRQPVSRALANARTGGTDPRHSETDSISEISRGS